MPNQVTWKRFEFDDGGSGRFFELCRIGTRVHARRGAIDGDTESQHSTHVSVEEAAHALERWCERLLVAGYELADTFHGPAPSDSHEHELHETLLRTLPDAFCAFADAWTLGGRRLDWTFRKTAARAKVSARDVATECVLLAIRHFVADSGPPAIPHGKSLDYYCCPLCVASIAEAALRHAKVPTTREHHGCGGVPFSGNYPYPAGVAEGFARWNARRVPPGPSRARVRIW